MARYDKYIRIINECDSFMEKKGMKLIEGNAKSQDALIKDMILLEKILCVMHNAWQVAWEVDRLDDIQEVMSKVAEKGSGPDSQIKAMLDHMEDAPEKGKDFRGRRGYSEIESRTRGGYQANSWPEEDRMKYRRRARSLGYPDEEVEALTKNLDVEELEAIADIIEDRHRGRDGRFKSFNPLPGWSWPYMTASRMGYDTNPRMPENNQPYNQMIPMPMGVPFGNNGNITDGLVHAPLQSMKNNGDQEIDNGKATANNGKA